MVEKISHKTFEIRATVHVWIENQGGRYVVMQKMGMVGGMPIELGAHPSLVHAMANEDAIMAIMTPNIIEGSVQDVTEFDKHRSNEQ